MSSSPASTRGFLLALVCAISVVCGLTLVFRLVTPASILVLRTPELLGMLGLLVLPWLTLWAMHAERRSNLAEVVTEQPVGGQPTRDQATTDQATRNQATRNQPGTAASPCLSPQSKRLDEEGPSASFRRLPNQWTVQESDGSDDGLRPVRAWAAVSFAPALKDQSSAFNNAMDGSVHNTAEALLSVAQPTLDLSVPASPPQFAPASAPEIRVIAHPPTSRTSFAGPADTDLATSGPGASATRRLVASPQ